MSRNLSQPMAEALPLGAVSPCFLALLNFRTQIVYTWTGVGNLVYNNQTFTGIGSLGKIGSVTEGIDVQADGTTLTLSGIDPVLLQECMTDIVPGATAIVWFALMADGQIIGTPYQLFAGCMDQPSVSIGAETISITLSLENKMVDLGRPSNRRYTSADQRLYYPTDTAFGWVEQLNDQALNWGG